ncbi:MAG: hypothetical protein ACLTW9_22075 [Enterocloster sp.]
MIVEMLQCSRQNLDSEDGTACMDGMDVSGSLQAVPEAVWGQ